MVPPIILVALASLGFSPASASATPSGARGGSALPNCTPAFKPVATIDDKLNQVFSEQAGPGWIGGDGTYSTSLPHGHEAFVFADTLIGTATAGGAGSISGIAHSSELYGTLPRLTSDYAGTLQSPQPLIPDLQGGEEKWEVASTYVENGKQLIFVNEFAPQAGPFDFYTGHSGIAVMSLPASGPPTFQTTVPLPDDRLTQWGNAVLRTASYTYIYGSVSATSSGQQKGMRLARAPRNDSLNTDDWEYWNGSQWVAGESNAVVIPTGNELTGVMAQPGHYGYEAISIPGGLIMDTTVDVSYACSPQGPWSIPVAVYSIPRVTSVIHQMSYIPTFHPELSSRSHVVVSYNVNTTDGLSRLRSNVHGYQPLFLDLRRGDTPFSLTPPVETPEAPLPLLLPVIGAILFFGVHRIRQQRSRRPKRA
jgi:hypothetical protein